MWRRCTHALEFPCPDFDHLHTDVVEKLRNGRIRHDHNALLSPGVA